MENFYAKYKSVKLLIAEYRNRAAEKTVNHVCRSVKMVAGNIFYAQVESGAALKIYKYDSQWSELKVIENALAVCGTLDFGLTYHGGKIYIIGGRHHYDKVSETSKT